MREIILQGETHKSIDDFYEEVSTKLNFPSHFMHNLTDFRECLTEIAKSEPVTIIWKNYAHARVVFGVSVMGVNYLPEVLKLLGEVEGVTLQLE